jgi:hypothetical protein
MRAEAFADVVDGLGQRSAAVLIVGMGGNGKTSLAREIAAHCLHEDTDGPHFDAAVWVSDKDNPGTTNQSTVLDTIARTLDYPGFTQFPHAEKQYEVEQLLRRQKVLLIIDNAETITDGALFTWLLRLPEPSKAMMTTREYQRAYRRGGWPVELRGMRDEEARTLLQQRLERLRIAHLVHDLAHLEPLLVATGGNPKAITMVAGLLKYERRPLQQIVDDLYAARGEIFDDLFSRAWTLLDAAGQRILMVMTFFPDSAGGDALSTTADVQGFDFDRAVERLTDLSLLDVQQADLMREPRYVLHPLVRAFAGARLAEQSEFERGTRERWVGWAITLTSKVGYCWDNLSTLDMLEQEQDTVYTLIQWLSLHKKYRVALQICKNVTYYYHVRGTWKQQVDIELYRITAACELGDTLEELDALEECIEVLSERPQYVDTLEELIQRLNALATTVPLKGHAVYKYYRALYFYYAYSKNDYATALKACQAICEEASQLQAFQVMLNQVGLAGCLVQLGDISTGQQLYREALTTAQHMNYQRASIFIPQRLAATALTQKDASSAKTFLDEAQANLRQYADKRLIAHVQYQYARLHLLCAEFLEAHAALTKAIDLFERMGLRHDLAEAREELTRLEAQMAAAAE